MSLPFATRVARRFVAGETLDAAIAAAAVLNANGMLVSLDHLGENVYTEADADRATQAYLDLLDGIEQHHTNASVSLKLTQLGLDVSDDLAISNIRRILERAAQYKNFVRIDMEGTPYTDRTLNVFRTLRKQYAIQNVGVVIQSYLRRSEDDIRTLATEGANVRLCKGAYKEPPTLAFSDKTDVDQNYIKLTQLMLDDTARANGAYIGVATHDDKMLNATKDYIAQYNIPKDRFEFQMLYGIRTQAQQQLVADGYQLQVYVPYGTEWYPYFMRRLAERPANVWFIMKNFFKG
jgi:proline dehydrogenase